MKSTKLKSYSISIFFLILFSVFNAHSQDFLQMGIDKITKKNYKGAIEDFLKAVEKTPKSTKAYFYLAEGYWLNNQIDNAEVNLKKSIDFDDENAQALKRLGDVYFKKKLYREALEQYTKSIKFEKRNADFLFAQGKTLVAIDSIDQAVNVLSRALDINPTSTEIIVSLGDAYLKMGVPQMALDKYKEVVRLDSNSAEAHLKLGDIYMNKLRMPKDALNEYIKGVLIDSTNKEILFKVSHLLFFNKLYDRASFFYKKYINQIDTSYQAYWEYGVSLIYIRPPQLEESIKMLEKAVKLNKEPVDALRYLSLSNYYSQKFKNAVLSYNALAKIDTLTTDEYVNLAKSYINDKDTLNAIKTYEKVIVLDPKYEKTDIYGALEYVYRKKSMFKEAATIYLKRAAIDSTASKAKYYTLAGQCYNAGKDLENAKAAFLSALKINPSDPNTHYYLGIMYNQYPKNDSIKLAIEQFREVIKLAADKESEFKDKLEQCHFSVGYYYFSETKNYAQALDNFDKCLKYNEKNEYSLLYRVYCLFQLDKKDEACEAVKRVLKYYPKNKDALKIQKERCWFR